MRYWLVRTDAPSVDISADDNGFTIWSLRTPSIAVGDQVVLLEGLESRVFKRTGQITEVQRFKDQADEGRRPTKIVIRQFKALPETVELDEMRYSLTFVRNTREPWLHFRRGYRLLPKDDFETLNLAEPFVARSGFFELLNALPKELQEEFQAEIMLEYPPAGADITYMLRLERLSSFLDQRIFRAGELLADLQELAKKLELTDHAGRLYAHVFAQDFDDAAEHFVRSDELGEQDRRFAALRRELARPLFPDQPMEQKNVVQFILDTLTKNDRRQFEMRFENLFRTQT